MLRETAHEYAQRRANETGRAYAVFQNGEEATLIYAALDCRFNRTSYAGIGANVVAVYRRQK